ncbi:hypothetical protein VPH35_116584 [Triticum aestivum]|uniref:Uncharacterized protein n=1 Tax=Aegilops tauschii subsp. strangulata TaxID=200361 RepID=A0A453NNW6_AEGTS
MARASHMSKDAEAPVSTSTLISVFVALAIASSLCIFVRAFVSCGRCIQNSNSVVQQDAHSHIQSSYLFFDSNPGGSILNRDCGRSRGASHSDWPQVAFSRVQRAHNHIIGTNSAMITQELEVGRPNRSGCFSFISDVKNELQVFSPVLIYSIPRGKNKLAHELAARARRDRSSLLMYRGNSAL